MVGEGFSEEAVLKNESVLLGKWFPRSGRGDVREDETLCSVKWKMGLQSIKGGRHRRGQ